MFIQEKTLFIVGTTLTKNDENISMLSFFFYFLLLFALFIVFVFLILFMKRITKPLQHLKEVANQISHFSFKKAIVKTRDELEELANSMNEMSDQLEAAHGQLEQQNKNLTMMFATLSHEIKTPLSLMQAYGAGIQEGLDDGTFLEKILKQTKDMTELTVKFLALSKVQYHSIQKETFNLQILLDDMIKNYEVVANKNNSQFIFHKNNTPYFISTDKKLVELLISNIFQNAIKYNAKKLLKYH